MMPVHDHKGGKEEREIERETLCICWWALHTQLCLATILRVKLLLARTTVLPCEARAREREGMAVL